MKYFGKFLTATVFIVTVAVFCTSCLYFNPRPVLRLDNLIYDTWMRLSEREAPDPVCAIVEIDDKSLEKLGQRPWPRTLLADLIKRILDAGALAVGLDVLFAEPDRTSPAFLKANMEERYGITVTINGIPAELFDNDQYFSNVIKGKPVVIGAYATFSEGRMPDDLPRSTGIVELSAAGAPKPRESLVKTNGLLLPLKIFSDAAPVGIINADVNEDGVIRSVPLLTRAANNIYAALSLRTLMAAQATGTLRMQADTGGLELLGTGDISIPVETDGSFRPVYMGAARTYPYFSAADVLEGTVGEKELGGRIIFIGASAVGLLDIRSTPLDPVMPGVEVHATLVDNFLSGRHVSIPSYAALVQAIGIFLSAIVSFALFSFLPVTLYAFGAVVLICSCLWCSWRLFLDGLFITPIYALLATILMGALIIPLRFWREQRAKRKIKAAFSHYVAPEVVNRIAADGTKALTGQSRKVSVLFTDVRNFTTISEKMEPDQLVRLLNSYFTPMTECVIARDGTLDKFIGDALMAFWNAPLEVEFHQQKAVLAALDMQKKLTELRSRFMREFGVAIKIGAGIHCGIVQVGNMGSSDLLNYTCIGDNVNLASRLEGLTKHYGVGIIVSSAVMAQCSGLRFRQLDRIRVKGSSRPLEIYTPLDPGSKPDTDFEQRWQNAMQAYFIGDFAKASSMFEKIMHRHGESAAVSLFIERCACLQGRSRDSWDGVWTYNFK